MKILSKSILVAFATILLQLSINAQTAELDKKAPDFQLTDSNGKTHKLSDVTGKYVVLEWINFDCPFVVKHYKSENMQKLQKEYTAKGVIWLSICSSNEGKQGFFKSEEINKRIGDNKAKMTAYLIDTDGKVGKMYGAKVTPHIYIIDKEGKLVYQGAIDNIKSTDVDDIPKATNYVSEVFNALFAGKPIPTKTTAPYGCSVKY